jgi:hypothetical protein
MEGLIESLRVLSASALKLTKRLTEYQPLLADPVNNVHARERALADVSGLVAAVPGSDVRAKLDEWLAAERADIESRKSEFRFEFGRRFVAGLEGSGMNVRGQLPMLRVGLFTLKADFAAGTASIFWGPEIEKLRSGLKLEPLALARTVRSYQERLVQKAIEPERLLRQLAAAYRRYCVVTAQPEGSRVFLLDLLSELVLLLQPESFRLNPAQEKFVEYPRVRFSFDLFRLKQAGQFSTGGRRLKLHVANFDATTEKSKALWVPDNDEGEGTHYSYVSFAASE